MTHYQIDYTLPDSDLVETYICQSECLDFAIDELEGNLNSDIFIIDWKVLDQST